MRTSSLVLDARALIQSCGLEAALLLQTPVQSQMLQPVLQKPLTVAARLHSHQRRHRQTPIKPLFLTIPVDQPALGQLTGLHIENRYLLPRRMKITTYNLHRRLLPIQQLMVRNHKTTRSLKPSSLSHQSWQRQGGMAPTHDPQPAHSRYNAAETTMLRLRPAFFALLFGAMNLAAQPTPKPAATVAPIRDFYRAGLERNGIVGSTLVLVEDGHVVLDEPYGKQSLTPPHPVDEQTTYHWASVTKSLTGIAIMQLRDRGLLSLDDPLTKYVPELNAVHDPYGPVSAITVRQAMSHSSGLRDATWPWRDQEWQPFEPTQWSQIVAMLPYTSVDFAPGSRYRYSNLAVVFLGEIIERLSGDSFEVYMEKNVLGPLGMTHSYYDRSPVTLLPYRSHSWDRKNGKLMEDPFDFDTGITRANGGLNAPMSDMVRYLRFLLGDPAHSASPVHSASYEAILKRSSLEEMWHPILPVTPDDDFPSRPGANDEVAASFFVHTDHTIRLIGHPGWQNGFRSQLNFDPIHHRGYLVSYNTDAQDATQNTRTFNIELRDYLIDHFFTQR